MLTGTSTVQLVQFFFPILIYFSLSSGLRVDPDPL